MHRNDPQTSPILWWPQKISTKSWYPKKYSFSENPQKILKFRILNPKKNSPSLRLCENIRVPPPPLGLLMHKRPLFYGDYQLATNQFVTHQLPKERYRPTSERSFERRRWWHDIMLTGFRNLTEWNRLSYHNSENMSRNVVLPYSILVY